MQKPKRDLNELKDYLWEQFEGSKAVLADVKERWGYSGSGEKALMADGNEYTSQVRSTMAHTAMAIVAIEAELRAQAVQAEISPRRADKADGVKTPVL